MSTSNFEDARPGAARRALEVMDKTGDIPENHTEMEQAHSGLSNAPKEEPKVQTAADIMNSFGKEEENSEGSQEEKQDENKDELQADQAGEDGEVANDQNPAEEGSEQVDVETVMANGREVTVDWNNRDEIKRAISKAAAYRDEKKAKDQALSKYSEEVKSHEESKVEIDRISEILRRFEQAKEIGPEAVIKLMYNRDLSSFQEEWAERADWSEDKKASYASGLRIKQLEADMKAMAAKAEEDKIAAQELKDAAAVKSVQNNFDASYRSHSFEGALGNADLEDELDERLFEKVKNKFNSMEVADISAAAIEEAMRTERARLLKLFGAQADRRASAKIARQKKAAVAQAQAKSGSGQVKRTTAQKVLDAKGRPGGWRSLLNDPDALNNL